MCINLSKSVVFLSVFWLFSGFVQARPDIGGFWDTEGYIETGVAHNQEEIVFDLSQLQGDIPAVFQRTYTKAELKAFLVLRGYAVDQIIDNGPQEHSSLEQKVILALEHSFYADCVSTDFITVLQRMLEDFNEQYPR